MSSLFCMMWTQACAGTCEEAEVNCVVSHGLTSAHCVILALVLGHSKIVTFTIP
jgi:hypothetical protein